MKRFAFLLPLLLLCLFSGCRRVYECKELNIIPTPAFQLQKVGSHTLTTTTKLTMVNLGQNSSVAKYISRSLRKMHIVPTFSGTALEGGIVLRINDSVNSEIGQEGYLLEVTPATITISANTETGLFYGYQTLLQMLPPDVNHVTYTSIQIPECTILDYPRFEWRGCELDVTRHFFTIDEVKRMLDVMASYKMNKFVWHLADDYGWRLESTSFPELNEIGSWRPDRTSIVWDDIEQPQPGEKASYGGYYSKSQVEDVVKYAEQLHIEVIPSVSLPNHCSALLASYPRMACDKGEYFVQCGPRWNANSAICVGDDSIMARTLRIIDEVVAMFPGRYIHLGGTEVTDGCWEQCPRCQYRIRSNHLTDEARLQSWFVSQVAEHLAPMDKLVLGWDALLNDALSSNVCICSWSSLAAGMNAARDGHDVVMCLSDYCALDNYQADVRYQKKSMPGMLDLRKAYEFDPVPAGSNSHLIPNIKGGQCMLWTEYIESVEELEYMLLPRLCAFAECLWSPRDSKDWRTFRYKIESHKNTLQKKGYNYCPGSFKPVMTKTPIGKGRYEMKLETEVMNTYVFFTTDGSDPTQSSQIYIAPVSLESGTVVKTLSVYDGKQQEGIYEFHL